MKLFAITPGDITRSEVTGKLGLLKAQGVSFLYIRSRSLYPYLEALAADVYRAGILPVIPHESGPGSIVTPCGVHFKSAESERVTVGTKAAARVITASCHSCDDAIKLFERGADYVLISPVFRPLSKQGDRRPLIPRDSLRSLISAFGEKVVALGGMTRDRAAALQAETGKDFSIAGISMFFTNK